MSEELLLRRVKAALDVAPADPALRARIISSLPLDRRQGRTSQPRWAPAIAAVLAVAMVVALILANPFRSGPARHPAQVPQNVCQLPVWGLSRTHGYYAAGFLDVSTGDFTPAATTFPNPIQFPLAEGPNAPAISYDRAAHAWIQVQSSWIAPDGMSYVYLAGGDIHIRYLPTQSDRVLLSKRFSTADGPILLGWSGGLVYYTTRHLEASDLWAIDPATGSEREILPMQDGNEWWFAGPNAIWASAYYTLTLPRYDTKTRTVSRWSFDGLVDIRGIDPAGNPIVQIGDYFKESGKLAIMRGDQDATLLDPAGPVFDPTNPIIGVVADGDRIWISSSGQKLWVYSADTGFLLLDQSANSSLPNDFVVAGGCVSKEEVRAQLAAAG